MDFSFVQSDASQKRKETTLVSSSNAPASSSGTLTTRRVAIPSLIDVQRSELRAPKSQANSLPNHQRQPATSTQPSHIGTNPFAFIDSSPSIKPVDSAQNAQLDTSRQIPPVSQQNFQASTVLASSSAHVSANRPQIVGGTSHPLSCSHNTSHPASVPFQQPPQKPQLHQQPPHLQIHQTHALPANAIIVNRRQEGNPVLKFVRNVRWQFGDIVPDYMIGKDAAALFISLRYHLLKPDYIHQRIRELQRSFRLRLILCHVDTEDAVEPLAQVTRAAIGNECTLVCAWSNQECARYLETFKSYENKPAEVIQKDLGSDYISRINATLTTIRGVNKTDVKTLGDRFGSVSSIFKSSMEELQQCPGVGPTKARRLFDTFHEPFRKSVAPGVGGQGPPPALVPAPPTAPTHSMAPAQQGGTAAPVGTAAQPRGEPAGGAGHSQEAVAVRPAVPSAGQHQQHALVGGGGEELELDVDDDEEEWDV